MPVTDCRYAVTGQGCIYFVHDFGSLHAVVIFCALGLFLAKGVAALSMLHARLPAEACGLSYNTCQSQIDKPSLLTFGLGREWLERQLQPCA